MKVCIIQPKYSTEYSKSDEYFEAQLQLMDQCDDSMDLIVMPEACDVPCLAKKPQNAMASYQKYGAVLMRKAKETARRCNALLFFNARFECETGLRNTTYCLDRTGEIVGKYFKQHLTPGEVAVTKLDSDYSFEHSEPTVVEIEGYRFAFLVCYDFYFYEQFANIARENVDIIIGCSHQRSDTHRAIEIMSQFLAYNTNAYVLRSSVSMDENSDIGGGSMAVAPDGEILGNMKSKVGLMTVEIDPKAKYYKPAGFGNPPAAHYEYIEKGRRPWKYRPAGSAIVRHDAIMPYPRVCAHRGFNSVAPENSMAALGAAVAMGADEIEFDLWVTKDGEIVSVHDKTLERVSTGEGKIYEHTYEELKQYDFGVKFSEKFKGLKILTFEEILKKLACHTVMNIHLKTQTNTCDYDKAALKKILDLIHKYDCEKYVYFMSGNDKVLELLQQEAPHICRCVGAAGGPNIMIERALKYGCKKIQLFKGKSEITAEIIQKAHQNGIICNLFWADDPEEAKRYVDMGIDTILTNDYNLVAQAIK